LPEKVVVNFLALGIECGGTAVQPCSAEGEREGLFAMGNSPQATRPATSAHRECEHYKIARRDFDNIRAYGLDDSCAFVAKHDWMRYGVDLITGNHICVAHTRGDDLDQHFIASRAFHT
jgi:hypothetical protein